MWGEGRFMKGTVPGRHHAIHITGGAQLAGEICVSGSKNAGLPEIGAALLTAGSGTLHNVPKVTDSAVMGEILTLLGGRASGTGTVIIDTGPARKSEVPDELGRRMRATIVLLGALLCRFGHARVPCRGGDAN